MQSTLKLFRYLYDRLPSLFPEDAALRMKAELESLESGAGIPLEKIEDIMVRYGYEVWPWNQAYKEFLISTEKLLGEHFLLPMLSEGLKERYEDFKKFGGSLEDLRSGRPANFFTIDDRPALCAALVEMQIKLRAYVSREIVGTERTRYLNLVEDFKKLLAKIKIELGKLRLLAGAEEEHPMLKNEMLQKVRDFEQGLCQLGPELNYESVCRSHDFFLGRKNDLNKFKGIHLPAQIDFYNTL